MKLILNKKKFPYSRKIRIRRKRGGSKYIKKVYNGLTYTNIKKISLKFWNYPFKSGCISFKKQQEFNLFSPFVIIAHFFTYLIFLFLGSALTLPVIIKIINKVSGSFDFNPFLTKIITRNLFDSSLTIEDGIKGKIIDYIKTQLKLTDYKKISYVNSIRLGIGDTPTNAIKKFITELSGNEDVPEMKEHLLEIANKFDIDNPNYSVWSLMNTLWDDIRDNFSASQLFTIFEDIWNVSSLGTEANYNTLLSNFLETTTLRDYTRLIRFSKDQIIELIKTYVGKIEPAINSIKQFCFAWLNLNFNHEHSKTGKTGLELLISGLPTFAKTFFSRKVIFDLVTLILNKIEDIAFDYKEIPEEDRKSYYKYNLFKQVVYKIFQTGLNPEKEISCFLTQVLYECWNQIYALLKYLNICYNKYKPEIIAGKKILKEDINNYFKEIKWSIYHFLDISQPQNIIKNIKSDILKNSFIKWITINRSQRLYETEKNKLSTKKETETEKLKINNTLEHIRQLNYSQLFKNNSLRPSYVTKSTVLDPLGMYSSTLYNPIIYTKFGKKLTKKNNSSSTRDRRSQRRSRQSQRRSSRQSQRRSSHNTINNVN